MHSGGRAVELIPRNQPGPPLFAKDHSIMARGRSNIAFWAAVVMAIASVAIACARREVTLAGVPLEWLFGGAVFFAILVHELIDSLTQRRSEWKSGDTRLEIQQGSDAVEVTAPESVAAGKGGRPG